ncbi:MAG: outer membrane beta-barrel protein [Gallionellaceae bacterium]|nr:outer membrane beta-barrel protein [Gallionellaceae bacterium]
MSKMKTGLIAAVLVSMSGTAFSEEHEGMYVLGAVGKTKVSVPRDAANSDYQNTAGVVGLTSNKTNNPTAYKLQLGYQFNPNFALEGGYIRFGKVAYHSTSASGTGDATHTLNAWNLSAVGILPLQNSWSVLGKLGLAYVRSSASGSSNWGGVYSFSRDDSKKDLTYGLGVKYDFSNAVFMEAGLDNYKSGTQFGRLNVWSIGAGMKF